jgi:hypothetical protein
LEREAELGHFQPIEAMGANVFASWRCSRSVHPSRLRLHEGGTTVALTAAQSWETYRLTNGLRGIELFNKIGET